MAKRGSAAGGAVTVMVNGHKEVTNIEFQPEALKNPDLLADFVLSALSQAYAEVDSERSPAGGAKFIRP